MLPLKGSVQKKLSLNNLKAEMIHQILKFYFLKGQFTIHTKNLQWTLQSPFTFAGKCNSPSANCVCGLLQKYCLVPADCKK